MYSKLTDFEGKTSFIVSIGEKQFLSFPEAPGNRHYEEYLAWVAEGNTAEVIEEP